MRPIELFLRRYAVMISAIAIILALYGFAQQPKLSEAERFDLGSEFGFTSLALPALPRHSIRSERAVHPSVGRLSGWISAVGASVALNDLDGDGLANDVCYVETRNDQVVVAPAPGTPARYAAFSLEPTLPFDPTTTAPMGCLPGDFNEDGAMDILVYYWGRTPIVFLQSRGGTSNLLPLVGHEYMQRELVASGEKWFTNAATLADLNGDGHFDLIIGNYYQEDANILDTTASGSVEMQRSMSRAYNAGRNRVLLWAGATKGEKPTVLFTEAEQALDEQVAHGWTLAVGAADLDGDLLPEIYFANDFGPDRLLHNRSRPGELRFVRLEGKKSLTSPNSKVLGRDSFKGMGVDFGDLNSDGLLDIYVSNIASEYALEESHFVFLSTGKLDLMENGIAPYVDRSESLGLSRSGWGWESRLGDFNNDGVMEALQATGFIKGNIDRWPELHELAIGNDELLSNPRVWPRIQSGDDLSGHQHNPFFVRAKDGRFYDISKDLGLEQLHVTRGIATADIDGDGDLDFAVANQWESSYLYRNESPVQRTFLGLHLLLPLSLEEPTTLRIRPGHPGADTLGRPAIGASATVHLPDGRQLVAQVDGGNGHSGARSPDLHFGLGGLPNDSQLPVDLSWRDPGGRVVRQETLLIAPGWHSVLLGSSVTRDNR